MKRTWGRLHNFDERSRNYPLAAVLPDKPLRSYTWRCSASLDQGSEGSCVGHGVAHELIARPSEAQGIDHKYALDLYHAAQKIDEFPDPGEGSSVLAGMTVARDRGWFREFRWTFTLRDLLLGLSYNGPAVLGIPWYSGMNSTGKWNIISPTGVMVGGHCLLANGIDVKRKWVRLHNSWGPGWGIFGEAWIWWQDLEWLLHQQGEACFAVGRNVRPEPK